MAGSFRRKYGGGPKTSKGKAVASRNSLKSGVYAATLIIPGEAQSDFEALKDSLSVELGVQGILEAMLLHEIAAITWKKLRLQGLEVRCITEALSRPETPEEYYEAGFPKGEGSDWALTHLDLITPDYLETCVKRLAQPKLSKEILEKRRAEKLAVEEVKRLREADIERKAHERVKKEGIRFSTAKMLLEFEQDPDPQENDDQAGESLDIIRMLLDEEQRNQDQGAIFVGERLEEAKRLKDVIRDQRLAAILETNRFQRGHDDLARAFSKALKELRSQQEWRRKNDVVDVTPNDANSEEG